MNRAKYELATNTGTKTNDVELPEMAILAEAFHCNRAARRDERNGFPRTAAMEWRNAADLFAPNTRAVEYCWREWERIMHLPQTGQRFSTSVIAIRIR